VNSANIELKSKHTIYS